MANQGKEAPDSPPPKRMVIIHLGVGGWRCVLKWSRKFLIVHVVKTRAGGPMAGRLFFRGFLWTAIEPPRFPVRLTGYMVYFTLEKIQISVVWKKFPVFGTLIALLLNKFPKIRKMCGSLNHISLDFLWLREFPANKVHGFAGKKTAWWLITP